MPGLAGVIRKDASDTGERELSQMIESMRHEDFYRSGRYVREEMGLHVGWTCHEGSFAESMPLVGRNKDIILIFQGENYSNEETDAWLARCQFRGSVSAEYLINLYEDIGDRFFQQLNGLFAGLLINLRTREITLFNDRYGMGRIYFYEGKNEFLFASEAKALLKVRSDARSIDPAALAEYLRFSCVTENKTLFRGVSILPNASLWRFKDDVRPAKGRYFNPRDWEEQPCLPANEFYERFEETVTRSFPRYVRGGQNISVALTGGFDSRVIMSAIPRKDGISCCTYGGLWGETFDIQTARKIAALENYPFEVIRITEDFLRSFGPFAERSVYLSDGTHDVFGAHDVFFNQEARKTAAVRLTGKFGSEVVKNRRLIPWITYDGDFTQADFRPFLDQLQPKDRAMQKRSLSNTVFEEIPWYEFGRVAVEQSQITLRTPYLDNDLVQLMFQAPLEIRAAGQIQGRYVREKAPRLASFMTNMGPVGKSSALAKIVRYYLYWVIFKSEYIYLYAAPHWLTRVDRRFEKFTPERFFAGREKFEGYRIWLKTYLADFVRQTLLDEGAQYSRFLNRKAVEKMVARHLAGTHNYLHEIGKALTLELICTSLLKT